MFKIETDLSKNRLIVIMSGQHDGDLDQFVAEVRNGVRAIMTTSDHFDILSDQSEAHVMEQARASVAEDLIKWCKDNGMRKSANVVGSLIQKMQIKRISNDDGAIGYFENRAEAEAWLDE